MRRFALLPVLLLTLAGAAAAQGQYPGAQNPGDQYPGGQPGGPGQPMGQPAGDPPSRVARLNLVSGAVSFQPAGIDDWTNATVNYPLTTGDHLYADQDGRAEMHLGPNAIRINAQTNFGFLNLDDSTAQIRLTEGSIHIRIRDLLESDVWEVDTPNGAVSLLRVGDYRIDTDPNRNATMVTVISGDAEVNAGGAGYGIHARETAYFNGDNSQPDVRSANPPDDFDNFCYSRDRREDTAQAPRYVSREMVGYEDLDANGSWSNESDYGPVWRPRVAAGWAPYRDGHWAWVEPWGWTWIDAAPWGFAPFHYGRWAYVRGGWGWCPGPRLEVGVYRRPVYAPALVAFVGGGGWSASLRLGGGGGVAWFPLGFNEPYVPAYHVSERYVRQVNVTNINVYRNTTIINNNYRYANQGVPGAIVAVPRQAFVGSQRIDRAAVAVPAGAFNGARVGGYTAQVAPERASVIRPGVGNVPRPSASVVNRQVVARMAPPPAPVAFAARQQALQSNGGRPLAPQQLQTIRQSAAPLAQPSVRMARPVGNPAGQQGLGQNPGVGQGPAPRNEVPRNQVAPQVQPSQPQFGRPQATPVTPNPGQVPDRPQGRPQGEPQDRMSTRPPAVINREGGRPQQDIQPQSRPQIQNQTRPEPSPQQQARPEPRPEPRPQVERQSRPLPQQQAQPAPQPSQQPAPQPAPQTRPQPQPRNEPRAQPPAEAQPRSQPQARPQPERIPPPRPQTERTRPERREPDKKEPEKKEPEKKQERDR